MYEFRPHSVSLTKLEFGKKQLLNQLVFQTRKQLFLPINAFWVLISNMQAPALNK